MKQLLLSVTLLGLMIGGYFTYQKQMIQAARQAMQSHSATGQVHPAARSADAEADAAVQGGHTPPPPAPVAASKAPAAPAVVAKAPAENPARAEIETALKDMHVTTIMPGTPGVFILGKQDYSEGEDLPLPKGRKARIVAVDNDGVRLACEGMSFHLESPVAPDLAALRKKK